MLNDFKILGVNQKAVHKTCLMINNLNMGGVVN